MNQIKFTGLESISAQPLRTPGRAQCTLSQLPKKYPHKLTMQRRSRTFFFTIGLCMHLCAVAGYAYLVIAEPLRRGIDGGIPSSQTDVVMSSLFCALIPGVIFAWVQSRAIRARSALTAYPALGIAYVVAWTVSSYWTAWNYRVFFGNTWTELEVLTGFVLAHRQALTIMAVAMVIDVFVIPYMARIDNKNQ